MVGQQTLDLYVEVRILGPQRQVRLIDKFEIASRSGGSPSHVGAV